MKSTIILYITKILKVSSPRTGRIEVPNASLFPVGFDVCLAEIRSCAARISERSRSRHKRTWAKRERGGSPGTGIHCEFVVGGQLSPEGCCKQRGDSSVYTEPGRGKKPHTIWTINVLLKTEMEKSAHLMTRHQLLSQVLKWQPVDGRGHSLINSPSFCFT